VDYSPGGTHGFGSSYTPFATADTSEPLPPLPPGAALRLEMTGTRAALHAHLYSHLDVMEASVAQTLLAAAADAPLPRAAALDLVPISPWSALDGRVLASLANRCGFPAAAALCPMKSASQFHAFRKTIMNEP
jgi:hypothetical protein